MNQMLAVKENAQILPMKIHVLEFVHLLINILYVHGLIVLVLLLMPQLSPKILAIQEHMVITNGLTINVLHAMI